MQDGRDSMANNRVAAVRRVASPASVCSSDPARKKRASERNSVERGERSFLPTLDPRPSTLFLRHTSSKPKRLGEKRNHSTRLYAQQSRRRTPHGVDAVQKERPLNHC